MDISFDDARHAGLVDRTALEPTIQNAAAFLGEHKAQLFASPAYLEQPQFHASNPYMIECLRDRYGNFGAFEQLPASLVPALTPGRVALGSFVGRVSVGDMHHGIVVRNADEYGDVVGFRLPHYQDCLIGVDLQGKPVAWALRANLSVESPYRGQPCSVIAQNGDTQPPRVIVPEGVRLASATRQFAHNLGVFTNELARSVDLPSKRFVCVADMDDDGDGSKALFSLAYRMPYVAGNPAIDKEVKRAHLFLESADESIDWVINKLLASLYEEEH